MPARPAAHLVGDAGEGDVALDEVVAPEQVRQRVAAGRVEHAGQRQPVVAGPDLRNADRGVDPVELAVLREQRGQALDLAGEVGPAGERGRRGCRPGQSQVGAGLGHVEAPLEQPPAAAGDGSHAEGDPTGEEEAAPVQRGALAVARAQDLAQPVDHALVGVGGTGPGHGVVDDRRGRGGGGERGQQPLQRDDPGHRADHRREHVERAAGGAGDRGDRADGTEEGDAGDPDGPAAEGHDPQQQRVERDDHQRPGDQHDLVVLAEVPDRELLDRLRRQRDDGVADGDDRRGRRPHERGGQLGEPEGDRGGQQAGQRAEGVPQPAAPGVPGAGCARCRSGSLPRAGHALPSSAGPRSGFVAYDISSAASPGSGGAADLRGFPRVRLRARRRRSYVRRGHDAADADLRPCRGGRDGRARGDDAALRRHHVAGTRRARRGRAARPARPLAGRGGALRARQRAAAPRRRTRAHRLRLVPPAAAAVGPLDGSGGVVPARRADAARDGLDRRGHGDLAAGARARRRRRHQPARPSDPRLGAPAAGPEPRREDQPG